jgi:hypothetical protein
MFCFAIDEYQVSCQTEVVPGLWNEYQQRTTLSEVFGIDAPDSAICFISVGRHFEWPFLVVTQWYAPAGCGFRPGLLLIPETHRLFLGAGTRLLCYDLIGPTRFWEDEADTGFWSWGRHGQIVLMAAELELAAWDVSGRKLWSRFVEPPWTYTVSDDTIRLDVMGDVSHLRLQTGERI